jgi:large subunit ribosomal protein L17
VPATPRKSRRFGGDAAHQKAMMGNMAASLIAAWTFNQGITTTEARAKALRPIVEKLVTKAIKGDMHSYRQVIAYIRDENSAHVLFHDIAPLYEDRPGGYLRILKLGPRPGDKAPMARVEFV